jgi:hypothetical protein
MTGPYITSNLMKTICQKGSYYIPAWKHYNTKDSNVQCDRCKRTNLVACIGWQKYDICLTCADKVAEQIYFVEEPLVPEPAWDDKVTFMDTSMYDATMPRTQMMTSVYKPRHVTRMRTSMYNKSKY